MLLERLKSDMIQAMKSKDTKKKVFLQVVIGEIDTESKRGKGDFTDEKIIDLIFKMKKKTEENIELCEKQERTDLVQQATIEISILENYLPKQLTEIEINDIVSVLIKELDIKDAKEKGKLMKALMPKIKGKADSKLVNKVVENLLK